MGRTLRVLSWVLSGKVKLLLRVQAGISPHGLAQFAGASLGRTRVKPGRKQAPACWLLLLHSHPLSPQLAASSQAQPQRGEGCSFLRHLQKQGSGCVPQGTGEGGAMTVVSPGASRALHGPPRGNPPGVEEERGAPTLAPPGPQACLHLLAHALPGMAGSRPGVGTPGFCPRSVVACVPLGNCLTL